MKIIDSHTHIGKNTDLSSLFSRMNQNGIGRIIFSNLETFEPFPDARSIRQFNDDAWELAQKVPDRLSFLIYLNPQDPGWQEEIARHRNHAVGVKLWISMKDPDSGSLERTQQVLQECGRLHLPVLLHVFNRTYGNLPGEIDILEFTQLARAVPECTMIAAHAGACIQDSIGLFRKMPPNVFWDLSGSFPLHGLLERLLQELPADRILYGSDGPGRSFSSQLLKVSAAENLSPEDREKILWRNAARIYRLPEPPDLPAQNSFPETDHSCDYHCYCGRDPFGIAPVYSPDDLEQFMKKHGVRTAFCTSLNSILHWDPTEENRHFTAQCRKLSIIRPLWTVNPQAHQFELTVRNATDCQAAGIWTSCYWTATAPDDPRILRIADLCRELSLPLFLHTGGPAEDRFRFPGTAPRETTPEELARLLHAIPQTTIFLQSEISRLHLQSPNHRLVAYAPPDRFPAPSSPLVYGSGFPYRSFK